MNYKIPMLTLGKGLWNIECRPVREDPDKIEFILPDDVHEFRITKEALMFIIENVNNPK